MGRKFLIRDSLILGEFFSAVNRLYLEPRIGRRWTFFK